MTAARYLLFAALLSASAPAPAWKIDTHLWLADKLATEVGSGAVTIAPLGTFEVSPLVRESIRRHRDAFLLGVIGPDLYPDMVAGQMTTHPGVAPTGGIQDLPGPVRQMLAGAGEPYIPGYGWQTDDWLYHVRASALAESNGRPSAALAFAMGYLVHAAMDVWAHTYVNLYTGDLFSILKNQEVAARHVALEGFVKNLHESWLEAGAPVGARRGGGSRLRIPRVARNVTARRTDRLSGMHAPAAFVRRTLILNAYAAQQYARDESTAHLFAMYLHWSEVKELASRLEPVRQMIDGAYAAASQAVTQADQALAAAQAAYDLSLGAVDAANDDLEDAEQAAADALADLDTAKNALLDYVETVLGQQVDQLSEALGWVPVNLPIRQAFEQASTALDAANDLVSDRLGDVDALIEARQQAHDVLMTAAQDFDIEQATRDALSFARHQALAAIDTGLDGWRREIESAVDAYVRAWEETAKEIMRPQAERFTRGGSPTAPLKNWALCWGPAFGIPAAGVASPGCTEHLSYFSNARESVNLALAQAALPAAVRDAIEDFDARLKHRGAEGLVQVGNVISKTIRIDGGSVAGFSTFVVNLWNRHIDVDDLNAEYREDISGGSLYEFTDPPMAQFLETDLGVPFGSNLSLEDLAGFAPLVNSMTLARMALLDGARLNDMAQRAGVRRSFYSARSFGGQPVFRPNAAPGQVLIGAIRSIDGNHQWQAVGPALARRDGVMGTPPADAAGPVACRRFGYPVTRYRTNYPFPNAAHCGGDPAVPAHAPGMPETKGGFRFWQDPVLRDRVFRRVFKGPLAPALCLYLDDRHIARGVGCGNVTFPRVTGRDKRLRPERRNNATQKLVPLKRREQTLVPSKRQEKRLVPSDKHKQQPVRLKGRKQGLVPSTKRKDRR